MRVYVVATATFTVMQLAGQIVSPTRGLGGVDIRGNSYAERQRWTGRELWSWPLAVFFLVAWIAFVWRQVSAWRSAWRF